jgi:hypothetical protein
LMNRDSCAASSACAAIVTVQKTLRTKGKKYLERIGP